MAHTLDCTTATLHINVIRGATLNNNLCWKTDPSNQTKKKTTLKELQALHTHRHGNGSHRFVRLFTSQGKKNHIYQKKEKNHHDNPVKMFPVLNKVIALFCFCWIKFAARLNSFWFCGAEIMRLCWKIFWGEYYFLILLFPLSQKTQKKTEPEECNLVLRDIFAVCLLNTTLIRELSLEYSYLQRCANCHK